MIDQDSPGQIGERPAPDLKDAQRRAILFGLLDLHRRMAEMEGQIAQAQDPSPFSQFVNDLSPTETRVVQDYFARIRAVMRTLLEELGIPLEVRRTGLRWAVQVGLNFLSVAVGDMGPERLRGYGPLAEAGRATAVKVQQELNRLLDRAGTYLRQGLGQDLAGRLARLEAAPATRDTLAALDRVVTRRGLVEFRPALDQVLCRLENPQFEIAVFGRVSSGKSSLLNHIAGRDVLPVGVTPITAVPTRLTSGESPEAVISFAETGPRSVPLEELRDYASEEGNPGNHKHVTGIQVRLPSPRLGEGVVWVDTPGVGSLARSGSRETLAYLPRCDLGVVLIDAASTLTPDDLSLLRQLYEAAVPAQVVLSKADLLTPADRQRTVDYVREQLRRELDLDLPVYPVSTVGADEALLLGWFDREIAPLLARHRALAEASLRRKLAHLRESVIATLQTLLARHQGGGPDGRPPADPGAARRLLDEADEAVRRAQLRCRDWKEDEPALLEVVFRDATRALLGSGGGPEAPRDPVLDVVREVLAQRGRMAHDLLTGLQHTLARTLDSLGQLLPPARAEAGAVRDLAPRGLPAPELPSLLGRSGVGRPWWAALFPRLAAWATRRKLRERLGPMIREQVEAHDRQVQAWLKTSLRQLVEAYEAQAEVFREQMRRLAGGEGEAGAPTDVQGLEADLRELRQTELVPPEVGQGLADGSR